jgi:cytochrome c553
VKNRVISILLVLALVVAMMAVGPAAMAKKNGKAKKAKKEKKEKVTLCHKAGPENQQTIRVSLKAAKTHFAHGDRPGECP